MELEETVSGNNLIPVFTDEPLTLVSSSNTSGDNSNQICSYLEQLLSETFRKNDILDHISESLDALNEYIFAEETEETAPAAIIPDEEESESYQESVIGMLEEMNASLTQLEDTGLEISSTVSGNSIHIAGIDATSSTLMEAYTEASDSSGAFVDTFTEYTTYILLFIGVVIGGIFGLILQRYIKHG